MSAEVTENDYAKFHIEDGIVHFTYKPNIELTFEAAKEIVADRLKLQNNVALPVLCFMNKVKGSEKPARDFLAKEGSEMIIAVAMVVQSPVMKIATDFYLMVNRPIVPTKVFRNKEEALVYLEDFKEK